MKTVIISDVHGDYDVLKWSLEKAGVINEKGNRLTDSENRCQVWSIGDLANCGPDDIDGDLKCLKQVGAGKWIDGMLMGNHEYPYFSDSATWSRFTHYKIIADELDRINAEGRLKPALLVGETLISHAGWDKNNHPFVMTAKDAFETINDRLENSGWDHQYFSAIGHSRGGFDKHGGIIWEDFGDLRSPFPQIVGHTGRKRSKIKKNAICIDTRWSGIPTVVEF